MRASSVPNLHALNAVVIFCWLHGSVFAVDFAILRSYLWFRQTVPKWDRESAFLFSFSKRCMRSVPFLGPSLGSFFEVCCVKVAEAQRFGFNKAVWLVTGRATWRPF